MVSTKEIKSLIRSKDYGTCIPSVNETTFTYSTNAKPAGTTATYTLLYSGRINYNDFEIAVTITVVDKETFAISGLTAATDLVYNGAPRQGYTGSVSIEDDKVSLEDLVFTYTSTDSGGYHSTEQPKNAGDYKLVVSVKEKIEDYTGAHADIYFTIEKATITITATEKSASAGDAAPALGESDYTVIGLVNGETLKTAPTIAYADTPDMTQAGTVTITVSGAEAPEGGNYHEIIYVDGTLTISSPPQSGGGSGSGASAPATEVKSGENIPASNLEKLVSEGKPLTVTDTSGATLVFDTKALKGITDQTSSAIQVEVKDVSAEYQDTLSGKVVFSLAVSSGSNTISQFGGTVTVSLPYVPKEGERAADITVWHLASDGTNPNGSITREQIVTILWRYAGSPKSEADLSKFSDAGSVSDYAADAMRWAVETGIIKGINDGLMPQDNAARAQVAAIIQRYIENKVN